MPTFTNDLDGDASLPNVYGSDLIRLQMQSPYKLYLYWHFIGDPFRTLRKAFGEQADDYKLALRIVDLDHGLEEIVEVSPETRNQWINAIPGTTYKATVGLYAQQRRSFISLLKSQHVSTPHVSISPSEYDYAQRLYMAGDLEGALQILFKSLELIGKSKAMNAIALLFSSKPLSPLDADGMGEMRELLIGLAMGVPHRRLFKKLTPNSPPEIWLTNTVLSNPKLVGIPNAVELYEELRSMAFEQASRPSQRDLEMAIIRQTHRMMGGASETYIAGNIPKLN